MTLNKKKYGHEGQDHWVKKHAITGMFAGAGFSIVLAEHKHCDVVGYVRKAGRRFALGVEIERSDKNVLRNVRRDLYEGKCDRILLACSNDRVLSRVRKLLANCLPAAAHAKTTIILFEDISVEMLKKMKEEAFS